MIKADILHEAPGIPEVRYKKGEDVTLSILHAEIKRTAKVVHPQWFLSIE